MSHKLHPATLKNKNNPKLHSAYIENGCTEEIAVYKDPHHGKRCDVCGQTPCVQIRRMDNDEIILLIEDNLWKLPAIIATGMCGPCTFGESACLDPEEW